MLADVHDLRRLLPHFLSQISSLSMCLNLEILADTSVYYEKIIKHNELLNILCHVTSLTA